MRQLIMLGLRSGLIALPLLVLGLNAYYLLHYGVDVPFLDDWRQYEGGYLGSFDVRYLFTPSNDTFYPVGLFLDSLAFRLMGANAVWYQFLSLLLVQGGLLWLLWLLLGLSALPPVVRALAFSFTLAMLQPDSYWGLQNMAYHQALPLLAVLGVLYMVQRFAPSRWLDAALLLVGFFSGMTYTSGAFAMLALSAVLLLWGAPYRRAGWVLLLPAVLCSLAQLWVIVFHQQGMHVPDASLTYPWQMAFWLFALGKIGRALLLSAALQHAAWAMALTLGVLVLLAVLLWRRPRQLNLLALSAVVLVYLALVAAGRASLRPTDVNSALELFNFGFTRFHFFWVTLLWPFMVVALWQQLHGCFSVSVQRRGVLLLALIPVLWLGLSPLIYHKQYYKSIMAHKHNGLVCLQEQMAAGQSALLCPILLHYDLRPAVENAMQQGASFVKQLPVYKP